MTINHIFHTSHCGSTLLSSMLSSVAKVYSEPSWTHEFFRSHSVDFHKNLEQYSDDSIIKYPSGLCNFAPETEGKKVFLYRNLRNHLFHILLKYRDYPISYYYEYFLKYTHPKLKNLEMKSDGHKHVWLWANRFLWMLESKDVLFINTNNFLKNKQDTLGLVCNFFNLQIPTNFEFENYNVKSLKLNHNDLELCKVTPNYSHRSVIYPSYGIIPDEICFYDEEVYDLTIWAQENIKSIPVELL